MNPTTAAGARPLGRRPAPGLGRWMRLNSDALGLVTALAVVGIAPVNVVYTVAVLLVVLVADGYRRDITLSALDDLSGLVRWASIPLLGLAALAPFAEVPPSVFPQAGLSVACVLVGRTVAYAVLRADRRRGRDLEPTLIVGAGRVALELRRALDEHPEYGLGVVGLVDDVPFDDETVVLGGLADLANVAEATGARRLIVAFGPTGEADLVGVLRRAVALELQIFVVPRFFELGMAVNDAAAEVVWGVPLYPLRRSPVRVMSWRLKRTMDRTIAGLGLVLFAPLFAVIAAMVKLTSRGPVFFRQERVGQHGTSIDVLKFRTMRVNDDSDTTWTVANDPRRTPVGAWLRRLSLDELPQLINIVKGDMSLIGPRPERPHFAEQFSAEIPGYEDRHRLPGGLTGYAQVNGLRGDTSIPDRARLDNYYIENWTPLEDMKILGRTVGALVRDATRGEPGVDDDEDLSEDR